MAAGTENGFVSVSVRKSAEKERRNPPAMLPAGPAPDRNGQEMLIVTVPLTDVLSSHVTLICAPA